MRFYVECPSELFEFTFRKSWNDSEVCPLVLLFFFMLNLFGYFPPNIQPCRSNVFEKCLDEIDEGLVVELEKSEGNRERHNNESNYQKKEERKVNIRDVHPTGSSGDVKKLLEGEETEELVLNIEELRGLKLHRTFKYNAQHRTKKEKFSHRRMCIKRRGEKKPEKALKKP